ncbi:MAG: hypothetical protein ACP5JP_02465 [bacterium]
MKRMLIAIWIPLILMGVSGVTVAEQTGDTQATKQLINKNQTGTQGINQEQLKLMERAGALDPQSIEAMRKQHYGDGEIVIAGALAKASNQSLNEIMALRKQGMGWGEIAQKYNLKLGAIMKSIHANINAFEKDAKQTKNQNAIKAVNRLQNEIQHQERAEMQERVRERNQQMQHEMNNMHGEQGMKMNEQHGPMNMHR